MWCMLCKVGGCGVVLVVDEEFVLCFVVEYCKFVSLVGSGMIIVDFVE